MSSIPLGGPRLGGPRQPIIQRLPQTRRSFERKYVRLTPILQTTFRPNIVTGLQRYDMGRVNRGANPLSEDQTFRVGQAVQTGQATTPPPKRGTGLGDLWSNAVGDIGAITATIPRLPSALLKEVTELPHAPRQLSAALGRGDIAGALQVPGIRMIPGAYTVSNIAAGNEEELARHPVFTALDVLPYAKKPTADLMRKAAQVPTVQNVVRAARGTRTYQGMQEAFGSGSRELMRNRNFAEMNALDRMHTNNPNLYPEMDAVLAQRVKKLSDDYPDYDPTAGPEQAARDKLLHDIYTTATPDDPRWAQVTPADRAYMAEVRGIVNDYGRMGVEEAERAVLNYDGTPEYMSLGAANRILRGRRREQVLAAAVEVRRRVEDPSLIDDPVAFARSAPDSFMQEDLLIAPGKRGGGMTRGVRLNTAEGYAHALDAAGYDANPLFDAVTATRNRRASFDDLQATFQSYDPIRRTAPTIDGVTNQLRSYGVGNTKAALAIYDISNGRYSQAIARINEMAGDIPNSAELIDTLQRTQARQKYLSRTSSATEKNLAKYTTRRERIEARNIPARFIPKVEELTQAKMAEWAKEMYSDNPNYPQLQEYVESRMYDMLPEFNTGDAALSRQSLGKLLRGFNEEAAVEVRAMAQQGFDPIWIHRVDPSQVSFAKYPHITAREHTPSSIKDRLADASPNMNSIHLGLNHEAMEWLMRRGTEEFVQEGVLKPFGRKQVDLIEEYLPAARRRVERAGGSPNEVRAVANQMMRKEYTRFEPDQFIAWPGGRLKYDPEAVWIPKYLKNNLNRLQVPKTLNAPFDTALNVFRTAVLPLAPRWHVYNILGGYMMLSGQAGPLTAFRYLGDYLQIQKALKAGDPTIIPDRMRVLFGTASRDVKEFNTLGGGTLRNWFEQSAAKGSIPAKGGLAAAKLGGKIVKGSFKVNAMFDDAYRVMAYLYAHDKSMAGKLSKRELGAAKETAEKLSVTESEAAGMNLARKVMQNWDEMTPFERSILRYIFPFYGFAQHIIRYAMRYPMEHPIRASIVGSFARNELEDAGTGLPERFLNIFFVGHPDEEGKITGINMQGLNPFADVANYFTLAGWVGSVNPMLSTIMEQLGVDVRRGTTNLFPDVVYDPITGNLKQTTPNPLINLVENTIPQSILLTNMLGQSKEMKELMQTNPEAADRLLRQAVGIPSLWRSYDQVETYASEELKREQAYRQAYSEALRTGSDSAVNRYPQLSPLLNQIRVLQSRGGLRQYTPSSPWPTTTGI